MLTVAVFFSWRTHPRSLKPVSQDSSEPTSQHAQTPPVPTPRHNHQKGPDDYSQLSVQTQGLEAAIDAYIENIRRDPAYQWKLPIRFYGKVLDQYNNPVADATVHFQLVNLQGSEGVEEAYTRTDAEGRFSLEGKRGKNLGVKISKEGYYDVSPYENQLDFEYANPAERSFYEPNANKPIIFLIRQKGKMEALIHREIKLELREPGATAIVDLPTGNVSPSNGQLQVTVWKPTITTEQVNTGKVFPYDWRLQIRINNGGLAEHKDIFPFGAPESGYTSRYDASLHPTSGASPDTTVDKQFYFWFGEPPRYGQFHLRTDGDRPYVSIHYWLNPSGSRNLEYRFIGKR